ncbi:MAG: nucleotidyltransferase family protein [Halioglobus sp.]|nr:nucleotidyltransferase family protein [Halioglobus sp.]
MTVGVLLLAAGRGRRFGRDKRLAQLKPGLTLLDATLGRLGATGLPILVCLAADDRPLQDAMTSRGLHSVLCEHSGTGMGSTLADGMDRAPDWDGVLVALADMPWIEPCTYLAVADALTRNVICVPTREGRRGHPVGFGRSFFSSLRSLHGDQGGRLVIDANRDCVRELPLADRGIHRDVDTPNDLAAGRTWSP